MSAAGERVQVGRPELDNRAAPGCGVVLGGDLSSVHEETRELIERTAEAEGQTGLAVLCIRLPVALGGGIQRSGHVEGDVPRVVDIKGLNAGLAVTLGVGGAVDEGLVARLVEDREGLDFKRAHRERRGELDFDIAPCRIVAAAQRFAGL